MTNQLSSGINVEEEAPRVRAIQGASTSTLGAVGITERGPFEATLVTSFEQYRAVYGGHTFDGDLSHTVQGFFDNGGQAAYVKRVVHYTDIANAATKASTAASVPVLSAVAAASSGSVTGSVVGPYAMTTGMTLLVAVDGAAAATATFTGVAATRLSTTGTYLMTNGMTLTLAFDGGSVQTVTFSTAQFANIAAATPAEVAAVINASVTGGLAAVDTNAVRVTSDRKGTGSGVNVTGGTSNAVLIFTTGNVAGSGNVSNLAAVTVSEVETIVELAVAGCAVTNVGGAAKITSNTTGASSSIQVTAPSTADTLLGFANATYSGSTGAAVTCITVSAKTDGSYGNGLSVIVEAATSGAATEFNLIVEDDGVVVETWRNLSVTSTASNYHTTAVNHASAGSNYISTAEVVASLAPAAATYGPMTGGADGLGSIADADFLGSSVSKTGVRGFDTIDGIGMLICPDRITAAVHVGFLFYAETTREGSMYCVLDMPAGYTPAQMKTYVQTTAGLYNLSEFGEINAPHIKVVNPSTATFGNTATITVPPCGHIAGMHARMDAASQGGVYKAASGTESGVIAGCVGFENDYMQEKANRDIVYPLRINPLRSVGGIKCKDGARTLKGNGNFPATSERRGVIFIEQSVKNGVGFALYRNNDEKLRAELDRTIFSFLEAQMKVGAFRSRNPATAFFVDVSEKLNPPSVVFQNKVLIRMGLATQKPAEFITIMVSQDTRDIELSLAG